MRQNSPLRLRLCKISSLLLAYTFVEPKSFFDSTNSDILYYETQQTTKVIYIGGANETRSSTFHALFEIQVSLWGEPETNGIITFKKYVC